MITALISAIAGLISGVVPDVLKEVKESRAATREMAFLQLNHQLAMERVKAEAEARLDETREQRYMADMQAAKDQLIEVIRAQVSYNTGIRWLDGLNAFVRPATAIAFIGLFSAVVIGVSFGYVQNDAYAATSTTLFSEGFMATIGFLFGYRSVSGQKKAAA